MEGIEKAKLKDSIAQWLIGKPNYYYFEGIYKAMNKPVKTQAHFDEIIREMSLEAKRYFDIGSVFGADTISSNEFTQEFLNRGGFVAEYDAITEANKKMMEGALRGDNIKVLTEKELKQKIRNNKWALPISILSIIIAGGALGWSIYNGSNNVSQEQLGTIESRLQNLENSIKQLDTPIVNDSIQTKE